MAEITKYFVDLEITVLSEDSLKYNTSTTLAIAAVTGETTINVADGTVFSIGETIDVGENTLVISDIVGNDITVDALTADVAIDTLVGLVENGTITVDNVYFTDVDTLLIGGTPYTIASIVGPIVSLEVQLSTDILMGVVVAIDDSLKDGLSPENAKRTTIFIDGVDVNNHSEVWIRRRNSGLEVVTDTTGGDFINMIAWPAEGEYGYEDRPQEGIDAGWDNETDEFFLNLKTIRVTHTGSTTTQVRYANMRIESDAIDSKPMFLKKGGNLWFENCMILNRRTHQSYGPFVRLEDNDTTTYIRLNDCYYRDDGETHAMLGMKPTDDHNFDKQLLLTRCNVEAYSGLYLHCTKSSNYQNNNTLFIDDSTVVFRYVGLFHSANKAYFNGYNKILIYNNSIVRATHLLKNTSSLIDYGMGPIKIDVHDSDIETTDTMFYFYHRNNYGHESNGYEKWSFKDSRVVTNGHVVYFSRPDKLLIRQYGDIEFKRCEINCAKTLVYMKNLTNWGRLIFLDNKILNCGKILHSTADSSYQSVVNIKDAYFSSHLSYGLTNADFDLSNVIINGLISENGISSENVTANNIVCKGSIGHGSYKIENSKIETTTTGDLFPNAKSAVLRGCILDSKNGNIANEAAGQITFVECNISGEVMHSGESWRTVFDSVVNGEQIPYFNSDMQSRRKISPVFRIGGSDGALHISSVAGSPIGFLSTKAIMGTLAEGASTVFVFFATTAALELLNRKSTFGFRYTNAAGEPIIVQASIEEDIDSSWDGLIGGTNRFKASANLTDRVNYIGDDKSVVLEMIYTPDIDDVDTEMYIDMNIKSE